jgi:O-antigen/teichoic acid export membrane protein
MTAMKENFISFLRYTEKYTKTDMVYLTKNGFWIIFSQIIITLSMFVSTLFFANYLEKESFGTYRFAIAAITLLSVFTLQGMGGAVARSVSSGYEGSLKKILHTSMRYGLLGSLISLTLSLYYLHKGNIELTTLFLLIMFFLPFFQTSTLHLSFLQGKKLFKQRAKYKIYTQLSLTFSLILSVLLFEENILITVFIHFFIWSTVNFIFYKKTIPKNPDSIKSLEEDSIARYGKRLSLLVALGVVSINIDSLLLWHYLGPEEIAIFTIAYAVPKQISSLLTFLPQISLPKFSKKMTDYEAEISRRSLIRKILKLEGVILALCIVYIIISPLFFSLFFPTYPEAIFYSQILSVVALREPLMTIKSYFISRKMESKLLKMVSIPAVLKIIISLCLIPLFGIWGLIFAIILETLLTALITLTLLSKKIY